MKKSIKWCLFSFSILLLFSRVMYGQGRHVFATGNLIGWWKMDESSGNAADSSGGGFTLTNNNVTYTTGEINGAASFNGTNAQFSGTGPDLSNKSFSISSWLYASNLNADQVWLSLGGSGFLTSDTAIHLRLTSTGGLRFGFFFDDLDTPDNVFTAGAWHQVTYTYNSTTRVRTVYIDGVQKASDTAGGNFSGTTDLTIGSWAGAEFWNGKIDDVKIYNRVLTGPEIADLAAGGGGPDVTTPTPAPTSVPAHISSGNPSAPSCTAAKPMDAPNLFQVSSQGNTATLYFAPVSGQNTTYYVSYGVSANAEGYGIEFGYNDRSGVIPYTVNYLFPGTWYFKVRGGNGCMPGDWSHVMPVKVGFGPITASLVSSPTVLGTSTSESGQCTNYTVKSGDTLWEIASSQLGNGGLFGSIQKKNNISTSLIHPGQTIKVGC